MKFIINSKGEMLNISTMAFIRPAKNRNKGKVYVSQLNTYGVNYVIDCTMDELKQWLCNSHPFLETEFHMA